MAQSIMTSGVHARDPQSISQHPQSQWDMVLLMPVRTTRTWPETEKLLSSSGFKQFKPSQTIQGLDLGRDLLQGTSL